MKSRRAVQVSEAMQRTLMGLHRVLSSAGTTRGGTVGCSASLGKLLVSSGDVFPNWSSGQATICTSAAAFTNRGVKAYLLKQFCNQVLQLLFMCCFRVFKQ